MPKVHETRFPVTSPQTGKLPTCYGLAAVLLQTTCFKRIDDNDDDNDDDDIRAY